MLRQQNIQETFTYTSLKVHVILSLRYIRIWEKLYELQKR